MKQTERIILFFVIFNFLVWAASSLFGQESLKVMQGDTIKFKAFEVTTLVDSESSSGTAPIPIRDLLLYHIHIIYEDGTQDQLLHDDMQFFPDGSNIIIEADATAKVGTHKIEARVVRVKPSGSVGANNIPSEKTILTLIVEQAIDDRPPSKWIITIHPIGNNE